MDDELIARFAQLAVPSRAGELPLSFQNLSETQIEQILDQLTTTVQVRLQPSLICPVGQGESIRFSKASRSGINEPRPNPVDGSHLRSQCQE